MGKNTQYNVWTDGSYRQNGNRLGAGWVIRHASEPATETHKTLPQLKKAFQAHGSDVAEMEAIACALTAVPAGSRVQLHVDCQSMADWLNAGRITTASKREVTPLQNAFDRAMRVISTLQSFDVMKVSGSNIQHNVAHRLSRMASSQKPAQS